MKYSIIGAGNLGVNLAYYLNLSKVFELKYIYKKSKYDIFYKEICNDLKKVIRESDLIFISTQESKIIKVVDEIKNIGEYFKNKFVFHTSNSLSSDIFSDLKNNGFVIGSLSPIQTFSIFYENNPFRDIYFLYEGEKQGEVIAKKIVKDLSSNLKIVKKEEKPFYHIAAIGSSNFIISVLKYAKRVYDRDDYDKIFFPLLRKTIENVLNNGVENSLTGPAKRGEKELIKNHIDLLKGLDKDIYEILTKNLFS